MLKKKQHPVFSNKGQGLIEYLILVALMGVATIAVMRILQGTVTGKFANVIYAIQGKSKRTKTPQLEERHYKVKDLQNFMNGASSKSKD